MHYEPSAMIQPPQHSIEEKLKAISGRYGLGALYVFGSRAAEIASRVRGRPGSIEFPASDVDIAVQPAPGKRLTAQDRVRLTIELEDLFGARRVDLVVLPEADSFLALDVIRGELLYCADEDAQAEDELFILRRAGDLAHYAYQRRQEILTGDAR
jgi:predicted nucleotidyltransferase